MLYVASYIVRNEYNDYMVVETAQFKTRPGVNEAEFLKASQETYDKYLSKCKGFVSRELLKGEDLPAPRPDTFYVYVILCEDGSMYIGQTQDILKRWRKHEAGTAAEHTQRCKPLQIVHYEEFSTREDAVKREKELKTGFGRKWLKREWKAGRTRQAGGTWFDLVHFGTLEDAQAAAAGFERNPDTAAFEDCIDPATAKMVHFKVVKKY